MREQGWHPPVVSRSAEPRRKVRSFRACRLMPRTSDIAAEQGRVDRIAAEVGGDGG